jgi:hypothetical protein
MTVWRIITFLPIILMVIFFLSGWLRTYQIQHGAKQAQFLSGTVSSPTPEGFFKGSVAGYHGSWQGKKFSPATQTGINVFGSQSQPVDRYPFNTSVGQGLRDNIEVLKIDYNASANPFWVRPVLDELVQTSSGKYLGKIHYRFAWFSFSLGYFELAKP